MSQSGTRKERPSVPKWDKEGTSLCPTSVPKWDKEGTSLCPKVGQEGTSLCHTKRRVRNLPKESVKLIANNKKAYHDYFIEDTYEAGIELAGTEVKSLRMGKCSIKESFIRIDKGEVIIYGMHVSPYEKGNIFNKDPLRPKRLLLHRSEINRLTGRIAEKGYTIMPLRVYFKGSLAKIEIGLAKGKKLYDKRADIAKKDQMREAQKEFKIRNFG